MFPNFGRDAKKVLEELQGKTAKALKNALATKVGISWFQQRLFVEDGLHEIQGDEILDPVPVKDLVLVVLEFWPPHAET